PGAVPALGDCTVGFPGPKQDRGPNRGGRAAEEKRADYQPDYAAAADEQHCCAGHRRGVVGGPPRCPGPAESQNTEPGSRSRGLRACASACPDGGAQMIPRHFQIAIMLLLVGILISGIYIIKITHKE